MPRREARDQLRRALVISLGVQFAPRALAQALPSKRVHRLGLLTLGDPTSHGMVNVLRSELGHMGFVDGVNLSIEIHAVNGDPSKLEAAAADLVASKPDIIVTDGGTAVAFAAKRATSTIPIVFTQVADPVTRGFVASLAHPGGNITGNGVLLDELEYKRIQLISEMVSPGSKIALLVGPVSDSWKDQFTARLMAAMPASANLLRVYRAPNASSLENAFETIARERNAAMSIGATPLFGLYEARIASLATQYRLPAIAPGRGFADAGLLLSYSPEDSEFILRTARYVRDILNGAQSGNLPVEMPLKFHLIVNMKTTKALGVKVPAWVQARANEFLN